MNELVGRWIVVALLACVSAWGADTAHAQALPGTTPAAPTYPEAPSTVAPPPSQAPAAPAAPGQAPATPPQAPGTPGAPQAGTAPPVLGRVFVAPQGLVFNTVRAERVSDFERAMSYFQAALEKSTDPAIRAQAKGWRMFKATEPGPNNTVLYVFLLDPTVPKADYSLGPILADAYPDPAELQQIWKLYTSAVTSGGTILNLTPLVLPKPTGPLTIPAPVAPGTAGAPATTSQPPAGPGVSPSPAAAPATGR